jgi:hypothetical protein
MQDACRLFPGKWEKLIIQYNLINSSWPREKQELTQPLLSLMPWSRALTHVPGAAP